MPRLASDALTRVAAVMPAAVITGARQTGKSTLVRDLAPGGPRLYLTLDDLDVLGQARSAPDELVGRSARLTLDEVQRAPDLLLSVKRAVDRRKRPGRFILTGSANLLLMRQVSETLAGRASYLTLWPMTRREQLGLGRAGVWQELLETRDEAWPDLLASQDAPKEDWRALARRGGYPVPALELATHDDRETWLFPPSSSRHTTIVRRGLPVTPERIWSAIFRTCRRCPTSRTSGGSCARPVFGSASSSTKASSREMWRFPSRRFIAG
ncbi:MAG: AAA family ATPase [Acidobacteria bacterium]|nr:AAA family ATPase [Acidobacteriota bacterium]